MQTTRRILTEAAQIALVAACIAGSLAVMRGVPDTEALQAESASCSAGQAAPAIHWIDLNEAHELHRAGAAAFVDARAAEEYAVGHIALATSVPMVDGTVSPAAIDALRGRQTIVVYGDQDDDCAAGRRLTGLLLSAGLLDVRILRGNFSEWVARDYPAEGGV